MVESAGDPLTSKSLSSSVTSYDRARMTTPNSSHKLTNNRQGTPAESYRHHYTHHHPHRRYSGYEDRRGMSHDTRSDSRNDLRNDPRPEPTIIKRRNSSFASTSSPWFRRNSLLSPSMIQSEDSSVYECPTFFADSSSGSSYNIISLKECQGFIFNQDLFASPYQQSRAIANEKRYRAISFSHPSKHRNSDRLSASPTLSSSASSSRSSSNSCVSAARHRRRHTSYIEPRPSFLSNHRDAELASAIDDDDNDNQASVMEIEAAADDSKHPRNETAVVDEYDEYEDSDDHDTQHHYPDYGHTHANRMFKVHVTEILVNEDDDSIFPT